MASLDKALNQLAGPTPTAVSESTMNMALTLHDTLLAFGGVAEAVSVISYLFCRLRTDSLFFLVSRVIMTREERNAREMKVARHLKRKSILLSKYAHKSHKYLTSA